MGEGRGSDQTAMGQCVFRRRAASGSALFLRFFLTLTCPHRSFALYFPSSGLWMSFCLCVAIFGWVVQLSAGAEGAPISCV
eukprot:scaffold7452_cov95-Isochrysis_galbana.AAC.4